MLLSSEYGLRPPVFWVCELQSSSKARRLGSPFPGEVERSPLYSGLPRPTYLSRLALHFVRCSLSVSSSESSAWRSLLFCLTLTPWSLPLMSMCAKFSNRRRSSVVAQPRTTAGTHQEMRRHGCGKPQTHGRGERACGQIHPRSRMPMADQEVGDAGQDQEEGRQPRWSKDPHRDGPGPTRSHGPSRS